MPHAAGKKPATRHRKDEGKNRTQNRIVSVLGFVNSTLIQKKIRTNYCEALTFLCYRGVLSK